MSKTHADCFASNLAPRKEGIPEEQRALEGHPTRRAYTRTHQIWRQPELQILPAARL